MPAKRCTRDLLCVCTVALRVDIRGVRGSVQDGDRVPVVQPHEHVLSSEPFFGKPLVGPPGIAHFEV